MKSLLLLPLTVVLIACKTSATANNQQPSEQESFLVEAIQNTPYSAVVKHIRVDVLPSDQPDFTEQHIYYAQVLETFRGEELSTINYSMFVEEGEDTIIDQNPVIVTLCKDDEGFYWPGTGAQFEGTTALISLAKKHSVRKTESNQTHFSHCN
ncbi:hypothetical protein [Litoribrevibacter albus]|uniref:Lipoprotein n=1 Tax=Litoribrevibacter albus TaxID=1473156 RepID=A0AA37SFN7_9GAMM|nr:hypothetical protein [Litoribrevibacter albus]GLQ33605.1 hypothetical protein GCM10007876_40850 [Litoribrevibacter albus]